MNKPLIESSLTLLNFQLLQEHLKGVRFDLQIDKNDLEENKRLHNRFNKILSTVDALYKSWIYCSKDNSTPTYNTARLLIPKNAAGAVILDATAGGNTQYELFNSEVLRPPEGTRNYKNVALRVSCGHKVGKRFMEKNPQCLTDELMSELSTQFANDDFKKRNVLIVTHKDIEPYLLQCKPDAFNMSVAHYGAVNGSNAWKDCDTVVIFGLPYKPPAHSANVCMAFMGVQSTEWLNSTGNRPYKKHKDIRKAIDSGLMLAEIVQVINRVRCRKVIDDKGNCPSTDVYILLPSDDDHSIKLIEGIKEQMPNIKVKDWTYSGQKQGKRGAKKGNYEESLLAYLKNTLKTGDRVSSSSLQKASGITESTFKRLKERINKRDYNDPFIQGIRDLGVSYNIERHKNTQKGYFSKH